MAYSCEDCDYTSMCEACFAEHMMFPPKLEYGMHRNWAYDEYYEDRHTCEIMYKCEYCNYYTRCNICYTNHITFSLDEAHGTAEVNEIPESYDFSEIEHRCDSGLSPLHIASQNGNDKVVKLLIDAKANINLNEKDILQNTALHVASMNGNYKIVELLIDANAKLNEKNDMEETPLYIAFIYKYYKIVKLFLDNGVDITPILKKNNGISESLGLLQILDYL
jgi:ankyrin repeat protein